MNRLVTAGLLLAACSRDLTTPPEPEPGKVTGRVVFAVPGRSDLRPAANAKVALLGTSLSATTNQAGTFALAPLEEKAGVLLFSFDSDGDGLVDRQRSERLEDWNTGVHRQVDMGDVVLGENAAVHGRVLLADKPGAKSGLGGSAVFVPEGPFTAYSNDDGSFALSNLPPGPLLFVVFRAGYAPKSLGTIDLRPAEDFSVKDVVLQVSTEPQVPGSVVGGLAFSPSASGKGDSAVRAIPPVGAAVTGAVADALTFTIAAVPPGLYAVEATRTGYTRATVPNVLVLPGKEAVVGVVLVTDQPEPDAGTYPFVDAGPGPGDAGLPDGGGCIGPACTPCVTNAQCVTGAQWCDDGRCAPLCSATVACTNGRVCNSSTNTCVVPCNGSCDGGLTCVSNMCVAACDVSFPCPAGQVCNGMNRCEPECSLTQPCLAQHLTCSGGQCVPKATCTNDLDCAVEQMCLVGTCTTRPTQRVDGGAFGCAAACDCRLGEWCTGGLCQTDVTPTLWFAADGGGNGLTRATAASNFGATLAASGPKQVFALRADDRFYSEAPFTVPNSTLMVAGGFVDCKDDRWVRSDVSRSVLATDAGVVLRVTGTGPFPISDVKLHNLKLQTSALNGGCEDDAIAATDALRLDVARVEGGLEGTTDCSFNSGTTNSLLACTRCTDLTVTDLHLKNTPSRKNVLAAVDLFQSSAVVRKLVVDAQTATFSTFVGFRSDTQQGTVRVEDSSFPEVLAGGAGAFGVNATTCGSRKLIVERSSFRFAKSLLSQNSGAGVSLTNCLACEVHDNVFDGTGTTGPMYPANSGIEANSVAGTFERNVIKLPVPTNNTLATGIVVAGGNGGIVTIRDNVITGGAGAGTADGIKTLGMGTPLVITGNVIDVGPARDSRALFLSGPSVRVLDNFAWARGDATCLGGAYGIALNGAAGVFERNRAFAAGSVVTRGFSSDGFFGSQAELYANHFWAGPAACNGEATAFYLLNTSQLWLTANTLDVEANTVGTATSRSVACIGSTLYALNNIFGSGGSATHKLIDSGASGCLLPANYVKNYLWLDHPIPAAQAADAVSFIVLVDAGTLDPNGNVFNGNVNPFDPVQPTLPDGGVLPRHRLANNPFVVDRGAVPLRADLSAIGLDLDGRPRDAGASADLGCCERH